MKFRAGKRGASRRRAVLAVGTAALAASAFFVPPAAAVAPAASATSLCTTGLAQANVNANLYSGWDSYRVTGYIVAGANYGCNGWHIGRHYDACGGGNAWLLVNGNAFPDGTTFRKWGYSPATCFSNQ
jgi:hypothetical protein